MMRTRKDRSTARPARLLCAAALFAATVGAIGSAVTQTQAAPPATTGTALVNGANAVAQAATIATKPKVVDDLTVPEGFKVELLHETDKDMQGSWVALANGPDGTLYASAQYAKFGKDQDRPTLFHIKPAKIGDPDAKTQIIPQPIQLNGAQGLYYGFGALYVMESGRGNGLMRVTDSDGDGLLDKKEQILDIYGGGEHGTHAIVPTLDGKSMYIIAGNMSPLPKLDSTRQPQVWDEDQLLQREPDARGHASRVFAPGGWICKVDPDGSNVELISSGYRNAYDFAVHPNGEIFAYDSDMEWDIGLPWYRPTRVVHATSGSEFGWRNGSGKWPTYFEDSLPGAVDIGPGSPVGVTMGTGAKFPSKYQSALFILDWTYGTIYAVHLKPDGASWTGEYETFLYGKALPLTDAVIGDDGAMYFTVGGRRGASAFYRVSYVGDADTSTPAVEPVNDLVKLRRELEDLHTPDAPEGAIGLIWSNLGHDDRFIRYAARIALENQPVERWLDKAKAESDPMTRTLAGLALARLRHADALNVLMGVKLDKTDATLSLAWLRAVNVALARNAEPNANKTADMPSADVVEAILDKVSQLHDAEDTQVKVEVVRTRVFLDDPGVVEYAVNLMNTIPAADPPVWLDRAAKNDRYGAAIIAMRDNPPPINQFNIAFMLRNMTKGWTPQLRQAYFQWLNLTALGGGGNSYKGYISKVHKQVLDNMTEEQIAALGTLKDLPQDKPPFDVVLAKGPGRDWKVEMAARLVEKRMKNRDFDRGAGLYVAACYQCHRVGGFGGQVGPDLSTIENKFNYETFLRATIEPNHEVSDQYAMWEITKTDGTKVIGKVISQDDKAVVYKPDPAGEKTVSIPADQVKAVDQTSVSPMPAGLVNGMSLDELSDLVAFVFAKADREDPVFKQDKEKEE